MYPISFPSGNCPPASDIRTIEESGEVIGYASGFADEPSPEELPGGCDFAVMSDRELCEVMARELAAHGPPSFFLIEVTETRPAA